MDYELITEFRTLLDEFSRVHDITLSSLYPFSANCETIAVMGLQDETEKLEQDLKDYITTRRQDLTYGCTISEFHIDNEPPKMVLVFNIE